MAQRQTPPQNVLKKQLTRRGSGLSAEEDEDLYQLLTRGGLKNRLRALWTSLRLIAGLHLSWQVVLLVAAALLAVTLVPRLFGWPAFLFGGELALLLLFLGEVSFHFWQAKVKRRLSQLKPVEGRPRPPRSGMDVFRRTLAVIEECAAWPAAGDVTRAARDRVGVLPRRGIGRTPEEWIEGWFQGLPLSEIRRDNVVELYAWAFFAKFVEELSEEEAKEVRQMVDTCVERFGWKLADGYNPDAKPIRIDFDPVQSWCKGLLYHLGTCALFALARQTMGLFGFKRFGAAGELSFYHRRLAQPAALILGGQDAKAPEKTPVVFIHGLGCGIAPYLPFIRRISKVREVFVVELPEISQVGCERVMPPQEMAEAIERMLLSHGHSRAVFMGHSYGTAVMSWVIRERKHLVEKAIFMDPICFLLAQPDVAYNFLYRKPSTAFAILAAHFVRWELYTANVLMRNFSWYHNTLWIDELPEDTTVLLSGMDDIIDPRIIRQYIKAYQENHDSSGERVKLLWHEDAFHGGVLLSTSLQMQVLSMI
eukprot:TRINITY_DN27372_c0_g1_i1.p1 TRINITY_DN27372_c0_g1~~TRINITY_DN27372_c0_g1_i1.p1  ORF type:complete len:600 (+),score=126.36 TRINITY_DN27372_c0_g1_i1:195-1802(+)